MVHNLVHSILALTPQNSCPSYNFFPILAAPKYKFIPTLTQTSDAQRVFYIASKSGLPEICVIHSEAKFHSNSEPVEPDKLYAF